MRKEELEKVIENGESVWNYLEEKQIIDLKQGDCLELMKSIPDKSIDMILCDLPYGCGKTYNKWDKLLPIPLLWEEYNRIIKDNGIIALFGQEPFTSILILSNLDNYRYSWIWEKENATGFLNANYKPLQKTEDIIIFSKYTCGSASKHKIRYNPQGVVEVNIQKYNNPKSTWRKNKGYKVGGNKLNSNLPYTQKFTNYPINILKFSRESKPVHPTQKPVELLEYLIKTYTNENQTVLDNCMGSGSTGVACVNTNRNFIGIELDENYFNIAKTRIYECVRLFKQE